MLFICIYKCAVCNIVADVVIMLVEGNKLEWILSSWGRNFVSDKNEMITDFLPIIKYQWLTILLYWKNPKYYTWT